MDYSNLPLQYFQIWKCSKCYQFNSIKYPWTCQTCQSENLWFSYNPHLAQLFISLAENYITERGPKSSSSSSSSSSTATQSKFSQPPRKQSSSTTPVLQKTLPTTSEPTTKPWPALSNTETLVSNQTKKLRGQMKSEEQKDKKTKIQTWECTTCTFHNALKCKTCEMCGVAKSNIQQQLEKTTKNVSTLIEEKEEIEKKKEEDDLTEPEPGEQPGEPPPTTLAETLFPTPSDQEREEMKQKILHSLGNEEDTKKNNNQLNIPGNVNHPQKEKGRIPRTEWNSKKNITGWRCPVCNVGNRSSEVICKFCKGRTYHLYRLRLRHGLEKAG